VKTTLVVNCSLKNTTNDVLLNAIEKFSYCKFVSFRDITVDYKIDKSINAVVLSGSAARVVAPSHRAKFEGTVNLIKKCSIPILGICFGHQLLCWVFGAKVDSLNQPVLDRFEKINAIADDKLFEGISHPVMAENHYDYVLKNSLKKAGFILLADSASCEVEAVKHKSLPFYGVQFHPERVKVKDEVQADGHKLLDNFFKNVIK
jgi:anthranilate synthase component 2